MSHICPRLMFLAAVALIFGCSGGANLDTTPVTGKVTYKGQPVEGATIAFIGQGDAKSATAVSGPDGSYSLSTLDIQGAMQGSYTVTVDKTEIPPELTKEASMEDMEKNAGKPLPEPKKLLPAKYGDPTQTPLKFDVKEGGENKFDLELTD